MNTPEKSKISSKFTGLYGHGIFVFSSHPHQNTETGEMSEFVLSYKYQYCHSSLFFLKELIRKEYHHTSILLNNCRKLCPEISFVERYSKCIRTLYDESCELLSVLNKYIYMYLTPAVRDALPDFPGLHSLTDYLDHFRLLLEHLMKQTGRLTRSIDDLIKSTDLPDRTYYRLHNAKQQLCKFRSMQDSITSYLQFRRHFQNNPLQRTILN